MRYISAWVGYNSFMKIVIDGRTIRQTGVGRYIYQTTKLLPELDSDNTYQLLVRTQDMAGLDLSKPAIELVPADFGWYSVAEQTKLLKTLNRLAPDLVHFPNFNHPIGYRGKFVMTIHDLTLLRFKNINRRKLHPAIYELRNVVMKQVLQRGLRQASAVLVPTEFVKKDIVKTLGVSAKKIVVVSESGQLKTVAGIINLKRYNIKKPFLLYVGNAYPHKNLERLILAFGKLITDFGLDIQLVIAGRKDAFHSRIEDEIIEAGLSERVIFTGFVTDQQLAGLYRGAELYVFPSLSEGFGLPGLEAMSYGLPVASSNATCLPEVYGEAVEYFDPTNIDDMAQVLAKLYGNKKRQAELVKKGFAQIKKYSWEATTKKTLAVYKKVLGQK